MVLQPAEIERFWRDGYMKYRRVVDDATTELLRQELDRLIQQELSDEPAGDVPPEFAYGHDRGARRAERDARPIHQFVNMWKVSPAFASLLRNRAIVDPVRELMGAESVQLWHDQVISKPPGDNGQFAFHHDFYFWPLDHPTMISCWLALDDATVDNGCMHVIPGLHRDPRYQPADCELTSELGLSPVALGPGEPGSLYQEVRGWNADRAVPVELKAGECMFHHCLNYHMTPRNVTDRQRRAHVMIFMPSGTRYHHAQSPGHVCTNYLDLDDGALMPETQFPRCGVPS